jgi:hypothetical protein
MRSSASTAKSSGFDDETFAMELLEAARARSAGLELQHELSRAFRITILPEEEQIAEVFSAWSTCSSSSQTDLNRDGLRILLNSLIYKCLIRTEPLFDERSTIVVTDELAARQWGAPLAG